MELSSRPFAFDLWGPNPLHAALRSMTIDRWGAIFFEDFPIVERQFIVWNFYDDD